MNWLSDQDRNLLAPKTLVEAVQNVKSKSLEELLESSGNVSQYEYLTEKNCWNIERWCCKFSNKFNVYRLCISNSIHKNNRLRIYK